MSQRMDPTEAMVRKAFDLLLEIRSRPSAPRLLPCAVSFLEMLVRQSQPELPSLVVSIRAVSLRKR
jgi:hypothetical protein